MLMMKAYAAREMPETDFKVAVFSISNMSTTVQDKR